LIQEHVYEIKRLGLPVLDLRQLSFRFEGNCRSTRILWKFCEKLQN